MFAYIVGPTVWLLILGLVVAISFGLFDFNSSNLLVVVITVYIGSLLGAEYAYKIMKLVNQSIDHITAHIFLLFFALVLMGVSILWSFNQEELLKDSATLIMALLGIATALFVVKLKEKYAL